MNAPPRLEIVTIAPGATLQDRGRPGWQRYGVTEGGALDRLALAEGQVLLGNPPDAAALELSPGGARLRTLADVWIALTGPARPLKVGNAPRPWRAAFPVPSGVEIEIGTDPGGRWCWLHMGGGIDGPVVLGARSTHLRSGIGLVPRPGLKLCPIVPDWRPPATPRRLDLPEPGAAGEIRLLPGAQTHLFPSESRAAFLAESWRVTAARDRQGMRIEGAGGPFVHEAGLKTLSDVILPGDIQITGDGKPAILLADRQPTGGYPRIFTVISADLHRLARMPTGHVFRFRLVTREEAAAARAALGREMAALAARLAPLVQDPAALPPEALLRHNLISGAIAGEDLPWETGNRSD